MTMYRAGAVRYREYSWLFLWTVVWHVVGSGEVNVCDAETIEAELQGVDDIECQTAFYEKYRTDACSVT
ncbi:MAG TPA: hypothetical protein VFE24_00940 [Pirellulales bacterium]|nr:hypothetical protein [Pirellulales bacterium]